MSKRCQACETELEDGDRCCRNCGTELTQQQAHPRHGTGRAAAWTLGIIALVLGIKIFQAPRPQTKVPAPVRPYAAAAPVAFHLDGLSPARCRIGADASTEVDESDLGIPDSEIKDFSLKDVVLVLGPGRFPRINVSARIATGIFKGQIWDISKRCLGTPAEVQSARAATLAATPRAPIYAPLPTAGLPGSVGKMGRLAYSPSQCFASLTDAADDLRAAMAGDKPERTNLQEAGREISLAAKTTVIVVAVDTNDPRMGGLLDGELKVKVLSGPKRGLSCWVDNLAFQLRVQ